MSYIRSYERARQYNSQTGLQAPELQVPKNSGLWIEASMRDAETERIAEEFAGNHEIDIDAVERAAANGDDFAGRLLIVLHNIASDLLLEEQAS